MLRLITVPLSLDLDLFLQICLFKIRSHIRFYFLFCFSLKKSKFSQIKASLTISSGDANEKYEFTELYFGKKAKFYFF